MDINKTRKDAIDQAVTWMRIAVREIDEQFAEPGYARKHPELVAALVRAAAEDQAFMGVHGLASEVASLTDVLATNSLPD